MKLVAWLAVALASGASAQSIRNDGWAPWQGWLRIVSATSPDDQYGMTPSGVRWMVAGGDAGEREVDVYAALLPGQILDLTWMQPAPWTRPLPQLPPDPITIWGGWPTVAGLGLTLDACPSGAAIEMRWSRVVGSIGLRLTALWYPDEPAFCRVYWSALPAPGVAWGPSDAELRLTWGDAEIWTTGAHGVLAPAGSLLPASGICTAYWPRLAARPGDRFAAMVLHAGLLWSDSGG